MRKRDKGHPKPCCQTLGGSPGGMPVILHMASDSRDVTLIGFYPTSRRHPESWFRILANAIYNGLD